jgi:hypothetical protein
MLCVKQSSHGDDHDFFFKSPCCIWFKRLWQTEYEILVCGSGFITNLSFNWHVVYLRCTIARLMFQIFQSQLATCNPHPKPSSWAFMLEFMLYSSWSLSMWFKLIEIMSSIPICCINIPTNWANQYLACHYLAPSVHCTASMGCSPKLVLQVINLEVKEITKSSWTLRL